MLDGVWRNVLDCCPSALLRPDFHQASMGDRRLAHVDCFGMFAHD